ncbi:MAG: hypothetical protein ACLPWS_19610 [Rhodomicrobium sp.]
MADELLKSKLLEILPAANEDLAVGQAIDQLEETLHRSISQEELGQAQLELIQADKLVRGRRGVQATLRRTPKRASSPDASRQREVDTYMHVENFLRKSFVPDVIDPVPQMVDYVVEITAATGGTAGLWTKPDLALATVTRYRFSPQPELELYGFEVKQEDGCTVYAVHEALAHAAFVHYTTVIAILADASPYQRNLARMREQAAEHGVGLIVIPGTQQNLDRYELILEPRRLAPALWRVDEFIETRFGKDAKQKLLSWLGKL